MASAGYEFFLNCWIMRQATADTLQAKVTAGKITQDEYNTIIATPQVTES